MGEPNSIPADISRAVVQRLGVKLFLASREAQAGW